MSSVFALCVRNRDSRSRDSDWARWPVAFQTEWDASQHAQARIDTPTVHCVDLGGSADALTLAAKGQVCVVTCREPTLDVALGGHDEAKQYALTHGGVVHMMPFFGAGYQPEEVALFKVVGNYRRGKIFGELLVFPVARWEYDVEASPDGHVDPRALGRDGSGTAYAWHSVRDRACELLLGYQPLRRAS